MDLKNYIADVISQTIEGVQLAQKRFNPDAVILPPVIAPTYHDSATSDCIVINKTLRHLTPMKFDIEVTAEHKDTTGAKAGFCISVAGFGANIDSARRDNAANRLSFQITIVLPEILS